MNRTIDAYVTGWTRYHHLPKTAYGLVGPLVHVHLSQPYKGATSDFYFLQDSTPAQVLRVIERDQPPHSHWLTVFCAVDGVREQVEGYERLGYHFRGQETLMTKRLPVESEVTSPAIADSEIRRMSDRAGNSWARAFSLGMSISPAPLLEVVYWRYILPSDKRQAARGVSIMIPDRYAYVDGVETMEAYRRRGFAEAVMHRMLDDAAAAGARESVLAATPMGKPLYQKLGYIEQGAIVVLTKP